MLVASRTPDRTRHATAGARPICVSAVRQTTASAWLDRTGCCARARARPPAWRAARRSPARAVRRKNGRHRPAGRGRRTSIDDLFAAPCRGVTTGSPAPRASTKAIPKGSGSRLAWQYTSAAASSGPTSDRSPSHRILPPMPARTALSRSRARKVRSCGRCAPPACHQIQPGTLRRATSASQQLLVPFPCLTAARLHDNHARPVASRLMREPETDDVVGEPEANSTGAYTTTDGTRRVQRVERASSEVAVADRQVRCARAAPAARSNAARS